MTGRAVGIRDRARRQCLISEFPAVFLIIRMDSEWQLSCGFGMTPGGTIESAAVDRADRGGHDRRNRR